MNQIFIMYDNEKAHLMKESEWESEYWVKVNINVFSSLNDNIIN